MTAHQLASNIAARLATDPKFAGTSVYLDALPESVHLSGRTVAIVSPASSAHPRGGATYTVRVVLVMDAGRGSSNMAAPEKTIDGFYQMGAGEELDALLHHVVSILKAWTLGAVPVEQSIEYDLASIPFQLGAVEATFEAVQAFGD